MTLDDLLKYVNYISNKENSGNTLSIEEYNTLLPVLSQKYFKKKYSVPEEFRVGMPFSRESYEITQSIIDSMHQFKKVMGVDTGLLSVNSSGIAQLPSDYMHVSSAYVQSVTSNADCTNDIDYKSIEFLTDAEYTYRLGSSIIQASEYPVATIRKDYIQFLPKDIKYVNMTYLRTPNTPYYDSYIKISTEEEIYLAPGETSPSTDASPAGKVSTSVELEYEDIDIIDIASILLDMISVNISDNRLKQFAKEMKITGV